MKELSIEEKAKAYDEAIERGKQIQTTPYTAHWDIMKEVAEHLLPELKESEGERIRKGLIEACKQSLVVGGFHKDKVIAWLEKQGEHQEYPKDVIDNAISFLANRNDGMPKEEAKDIVNAIITVLNPSYWPKQGEQKPAWSEENEEIYRKCICAMRASACGFPEEEKFVEQVDNWLKSLKERVQPQNTWKPSEEMLEALYRVIPENVMEKSEDDMLLDKLYQGLKYGKVLSEK